MLNTIFFDGTAVTPSKILCIGRNYVEHIQELNNSVPEQMVLFQKPNSAISETLRAHHGEPLHFETELCFLVENGRYVGVGLGLDLTKRALQGQLKQRGLPWERAKAFDGSVCFSAFVPLPDSLDGLQFKLYINDTLRQQGHTSLMLHTPEQIRQELSSVFTLTDGDIVMTGTPKGVGAVEQGARYRVTLTLHGSLLIEHEWLAIAGV